MSREMFRTYRIAVFCGAFPLLSGIAIFLAWLVTRDDRLMAVGLFILCAGLVFFAVGIAALARFWTLARRTPNSPHQRFRRLAFASAALLIVNFPAAGIIIVAAATEYSRYTVVIRNTSTALLEDVRVFGGGCDMFFGSIRSGRVERRNCRPQHEGVLELQAVSGSTTHTAIVSGYVDGGLGGLATVTIDSNGAITVVNAGAW